MWSMGVKSNQYSDLTIIDLVAWLAGIISAAV
jgi:hypothetical protein